MIFDVQSLPFKDLFSLEEDTLHTPHVSAKGDAENKTFGRAPRAGNGYGIGPSGDPYDEGNGKLYGMTDTLAPNEELYSTEFLSHKEGNGEPFVWKILCIMGSDIY